MLLGGIFGLQNLDEWKCFLIALCRVQGEDSDCHQDWLLPQYFSPKSPQHIAWPRSHATCPSALSRQHSANPKFLTLNLEI